VADCIDLQTQTKQAHWNVKRLNSITPHELFDGINNAELAASRALTSLLVLKAARAGWLCCHRLRGVEIQ
jgi:hypothetical protein